MRPDPGPQELVAADLDDAALVAAIPWASLAEAPALAAEAGRRGLVAAVPALEQSAGASPGSASSARCPSRSAALDALALIGGSKSARTVARLIAKDIVQGPTRKVAVAVAAQLKSALPVETVLALLQDADPKVRADACRCAGPWPAILQVLLDLADDSDSEVRVAAACALGRMGRHEARPALGRLLRDAPSMEIIDAIPGHRRRGLHHPPRQDCPHPAGPRRRRARRLGDDRPPARRQILAAIKVGRDE